MRSTLLDFRAQRVTDPALPRAPHRRTARGKKSQHEVHRHTSATPCKHHLHFVKINPPSGVFILSSPCCVILPPCHSGGECGQIEEVHQQVISTGCLTIFFCLCFQFQKERYSSPEDGRTASPANGGQPAPAANCRTSSCTSGPG